MLSTIKENRELTCNLVTQFWIIRHFLVIACPRSPPLSPMYTANRFQQVFLLKVLVPV